MALLDANAGTPWLTTGIGAGAARPPLLDEELPPELDELEPVSLVPPELEDEPELSTEVPPLEELLASVLEVEPELLDELSSVVALLPPVVDDVELELVDEVSLPEELVAPVLDEDVALLDEVWPLDEVELALLELVPPLPVPVLEDEPDVLEVLPFPPCPVFVVVPELELDELVCGGFLSASTLELSASFPLPRPEQPASASAHAATARRHPTGRLRQTGPRGDAVELRIRCAFMVVPPISRRCCAGLVPGLVQRTRDVRALATAPPQSPRAARDRCGN